MHILFYIGLVLGLLALGLAALASGGSRDLFALADGLFLRGALVVFLYLFWRFVKAHEARRTEERGTPE